MKRHMGWIGILILFGTGTLLAPAAFGWNLLEGFSGLFMTFFLCYCAIILVAQVFSAVAALRSVLARSNERKKVARRGMLP